MNARVDVKQVISSFFTIKALKQNKRATFKLIAASVGLVLAKAIVKNLKIATEMFVQRFK